MDWLLTSDVWNTVIEVLRSINNNVQSKHTSIQETDVLHSTTKRRQKVDQLSDVDYVPTTHILLSMPRRLPQRSSSVIFRRQRDFGFENNNARAFARSFLFGLISNLDEISCPCNLLGTFLSSFLTMSCIPTIVGKVTFLNHILTIQGVQCHCTPVMWTWALFWKHTKTCRIYQ